MAWGVVELEPEVQKWLESLSIAEFAHAAFYVDLLAEQGRGGLGHERWWRLGRDAGAADG